MFIKEDFLEFVNGYLESALFCESLEDSEFSISQDSVIEQSYECFQFLTEAYNKIPGFKQAGRDFWLTRNYHGAGFWSKPEIYKEHCQFLTDLSHEYDTRFVGITDNNFIEIW